MIDIIMIMVCCTLFNQMGLCEAIEHFIRHKIPIINCAKCFTFWTSFTYLIFIKNDILLSLFYSFIMSYISIWLELFLGYMTIIYNKLCNEIHTSEKNQGDRDECDPENKLP